MTRYVVMSSFKAFVLTLRSNQEYEKQLAYAILSYLRAGQFDEAMNLCFRCHQPWLAAMMSGAKAFSWMAVTSREPLPEDGLGMDTNAMQEDGDNARWSGNKRRKLWRDACIRATAPVDLSSNTLGLRKVRMKSLPRAYSYLLPHHSPVCLHPCAA